MSSAATSRLSAVVFCGALVAVGVGAAIGLATVPRVGTFLGMLLGGVLLGVVISPRPLAESAIAAAVVNLGIVATTGVPGRGIVGAMTALGSVAPETLLPSLALSAAAGGFGAHLGDDLRDGLSQPLDDSSVTGSRSASSPDRARSTTTDSTAGDATASATTDIDRETVRESTDE